MNKHGYFSEDGTEFIVTNPNLRKEFDNFLFNDVIFSYVQQTGVGYCCYRFDDPELTELLPGHTDVEYKRPAMMNRLFYIRDRGTGEFWNLNWEPVKKAYEYFRCIHGLGYTIIETSVRDLAASFRVFVPAGRDAVELWTVKIKNNTGQKKELSLFGYNEFSFKFLWGFFAYGHHIYKTSEFNRELNAMVATKHPEHKPHNNLTGFLTSDVAIDAFDGSRDFFLGKYNLLNEPLRVVEGNCSNSKGSTEEITGAVQFNFSLNPGEEKVINFVLGATDSVEGIRALKEKYLGRMEHYFAELKREKQAMIATNTVATPDEQFNRLINIWCKQQMLYGCKWTRWGYKGYRDIVQHAFGISNVYPELCKEIILEAYKHQYSSGLALRGWMPVDNKAYSDSALWVIYTLLYYIKETGDFDILDITVPYYDRGESTILEHIQTTLDYLERNKGARGLTLIKDGDWNDSLTNIGRGGKGESIWVSMAYASCLQEVATLYRYLGRPEQEQECLRRYDSIVKAINEKGWDGEWYLRCINDVDRPIGSRENEEGKIYINSQSWSIICGAADEKRAAKVIESLDKYLLTGAGYRKLTPAYTKFKADIGRITAMEPGIAENGTIYAHGNAFVIWAFLKMRLGDKAYDTFKRVAPGYFHGEDDPKLEGPYYTFPNCYFGDAHKNSPFIVEFPWITGSVNWFYNLAFEYMIGVRKEYDGLSIDPLLPREWDVVRMQRSLRGKTFDITIDNKCKTGAPKVSIVLNGKKHEGNKIKYADCQTNNKIEVVLCD